MKLKGSVTGNDIKHKNLKKVIAIVIITRFFRRGSSSHLKRRCLTEDNKKNVRNEIVEEKDNS